MWENSIFRLRRAPGLFRVICVIFCLQVLSSAPASIKKFVWTCPLLFFAATGTPSSRATCLPSLNLLRGRCAFETNGVFGTKLIERSSAESFFPRKTAASRGSVVEHGSKESLTCHTKRRTEVQPFRACCKLLQQDQGHMLPPSELGPNRCLLPSFRFQVATVDMVCAVDVENNISTQQKNLECSTSTNRIIARTVRIVIAG